MPKVLDHHQIIIPKVLARLILIPKVLDHRIPEITEKVLDHQLHHQIRETLGLHQKGLDQLAVLVIIQHLAVPHSSLQIDQHSVIIQILHLKILGQNPLVI